MSKSETKLEPVSVEAADSCSRADTRASSTGAVFHDVDSGRVTLSLDGPPLSLPDELFEHVPGDETHAVNVQIGNLKSAVEAHPALSAK